VGYRIRPETYLFALTCALLGATNPAWSQTSLAAIVGDVRDTSGTEIPKATVILTNENTGAKTDLGTNEVGAFSSSSLQPGTYRLEATSSGFKSYVATHIELRTGQILRQDVVLEIGTLNQQVEVVAQAGAAELQRDSGDISSALNFQTVQEMPSGTRKVLELVALTPGVTLTGSGSTQAQELAFFSIAGNPGTRGAMFVLDGTSTAFPRVQGDGGNLPAVNPPTEAVQEMRIVASSASAEFGQGIGGVVMMATKSGTNSLRGDGYFFGQNNSLNARNFFSSGVPEVRYDNYGFVVGGPIKKNKTFFFYNLERERNIGWAPQVLTLPTLLQRSGDFSQTFDAKGNLVVIYDPATTQTLPDGTATRQPFPGNIIPSSKFDPVANNLLTNYVPPPNQPGTLAGANNFLANAEVNNVHRLWNLGRVDHDFTDSDKIYARVSVDRPEYPEGGPYHGISGAQHADPGDVNVTQLNKTVGIGYTKVINAATLSDFRFSFVSFNLNLQALGDDPTVWQQNSAAKIGLKNLSIDTFPYFAPSGYYGIGGSGAAFGGRQDLIYKVFRATQFGETISRQVGRHAVKFGGEYIGSRGIYASRVWPSGQSTYDPRATALPGVAGTGNSMASFLLGQVATAQIVDEPAPDMRTWYLGAFLQDDWRVNNHLTVNFGVRYEFDRPKTDVTDSQNFFDFDAINPVCNCKGAIVFTKNLYATTQEHHELYNAQTHDIAPRVGFAWTPFAKDDFVVRGGYGIFYAGADYGDIFWDGPQAGAGKGTWQTDGLGLQPAFVLSQGFPALPSQALNNSWGAVPIGQSPIFSPAYWVQNRPVIYDEQWNLGIQKRLGRTLLEVGYMGNAGKHLPDRGYNPNQLLPALMGPGNMQIRLPYPQFGIMAGYSNDEASSLYHAALVSVRRHFSNGLSFQANYVFSRFLDDISYKRSDYNRKLDYGPSSLQRTSNFVWSGVYEFPFGKGKTLLTEGAGSKILGGWLLGGFTQVQTGPPINFSTSTNTCNCNTSGTQGVNVTGPPHLTSNFNPGSTTWFNTSVFSNATPYTFGNAGPGIVKGPGLFTVNLNLTRRFAITERFALEFRVDSFNVLNWVNFNGPGSTYGTPGFGFITSAQPGRVIQYGGKIFF
jgi:hypothetical protein